MRLNVPTEAQESLVARTTESKENSTSTASGKSLSSFTDPTRTPRTRTGRPVSRPRASSRRTVNIGPDDGFEHDIQPSVMAKNHGVQPVSARFRGRALAV